MCMVDGEYECVEIIRDEHQQQARKNHKCMECYRVIARGEKYYATAFVFDGQFTNYKICPHCWVVKDWLNKECKGFIYTMIGEDIEEHFREGGYGLRIGRLAAGMKRKWRTLTGDLMPIPQMPKTTKELLQASTCVGCPRNGAGG